MKPLFLSLLVLFSLPARAAFDPETVVFIGSSSVEFWRSMATDFAPLQTLNLGVKGTTYQYLERHAEEFATRYPARRYVIYSGDNDLSWLGTSDGVVAGFRAVAETLHRKIPGVKVYLLSIKPNANLVRRLHFAQVQRTNEKLEEEASRLGYVTFVDVNTPMLSERGNPRPELFGIDGIHMNARGYAIWRDKLRPLLLRDRR